MKKLSVFFSLALLIILFVALVVVNNQVLSQFRADLTENDVYSLSEGSKAVLDELEEPVTLYFFFSDTASKGMTGLRNYANRVQSLLEEYEQASGGKVKLNIVDPEPFSEAEDQATQFGLTGAAIGSVGDSVYFGLAGTNTLDDQFTIGFFDPQKEQFLEYEISKLIYQLSDPDPVTLALVTSLPVSGGQNPMTGQYRQPMVIYEQLSQLFNVEVVTEDAQSLPADTDVVMLAHPTGLSESLKYAIDQFVMNDGRVLAFVDPHYESDPLAAMGAMQANASDSSLLRAWGIKLVENKVVLDEQLGLEIRAQAGGIVRHPGILGLSEASLNREDVTTANLEVINGASFGTLTLSDSSELQEEVLMTTSANALLLDAQTYAQTPDPASLLLGQTDERTRLPLAARYTGKLSSAFDAAPADTDEALIPTTDNANIIVVADVDTLVEQFWVQQSSFFGQTLYTPFANNGDFVTNATENLAGSNSLISVRSRGTFARPFTRVQAIEMQAEARFREQEEKLQKQLADTEQQLAQLQSQQSQGGALVLTDEQQSAIDDFMQQRLEIRKALRDVRYQLERDIDALGNWLKLINIAAAPLALVFLLFVLAWLLRRRAPASMKEERE
ncbi:GldG family protein [Alteromonas sp. ASW11-19]|uniref:GldG family protein n=1 Tax=Alteromonas salexigens TaxID=2982530 RepID=A0ABT2VQW6_9ALTE|nr:GldG family protein [Alteromonas salexigens]MCU7555702.1 GldG family protein [Alteromonas salexigens]